MRAQHKIVNNASHGIRHFALTAKCRIKGRIFVTLLYCFRVLFPHACYISCLPHSTSI